VQGGTAGTTTGVYYPATNQLALATNGTQAVLVDSSQNVGIGTSSPAAKVDVTVGSGVNIQLTKSTGAALTFSDGAIRAALQGINGADGLTINTGSGITERIRIDASGNVGIGNTSPGGYKLAIGDGSSNRGRIMLKGATSGNYPEINIDDTMNTSGKNYQLYSTGGVLKVSNQTDATVSFVSNAFGIGLGDIAAVDGKGIRFPATQSASSNANTLDDYEEGTWVPSIGTQTQTFTMTEQQGIYVKVGQMVTVVGIMSWSSKASAASGDALVMKNLPFTSNSDVNNNRMVGVFGISPATSTNWYSLWLYGGGGQTYINVTGKNSLTAGSADLVVSDIQSSSVSRFSITYITN
jgi:hypothetical protein